MASQLSSRGIDVIIVSAETSFLPKPVSARALIDKPYREEDVLAAVASVKAAQATNINKAR